MAMLIREEHNLPTLRLRLRARRDAFAETTASAGKSSSTQDQVITRPLLSSQIVHGEQAVSPWVDTELDALGITRSIDPNISRPRSGTDLPSTSLAALFTQNPWSPPNLGGTAIAGQIAGLAQEADGSLLWLHIAQDSAPLALLPWEAMIRPLTPIPFVRIPNFLNAPFAPATRPTIVICASAPVGDGPYACQAFISAVIAAILAAAQTTQASPVVHVFVDQEIVETTIAGLGPPQPNVRVHRFEPPTDRSDLRSGRDMWMDWIVGKLNGEPADIIHFISPGYLGTDYGAIVLAESPVRNERKGTFLGASDLSRFYDRVGCTAMAFSNPDMREWVAGQRSLAFELSWMRAGPIVLTEAPHQSLDALTAVYTLLFGRGDIARQTLTLSAAPVQFSCHPALFNLHATRASTPIEKFDAASAYIRNQGALLAPTRSLSGTEQAEKRGSEAAVDFLTSLIGKSQL